jgi:hypothetical protein
LLAIALLAGCDGGSAGGPALDEAKPFADDFVRRLVAGRPVVDDTAPLLRAELRRFQRTIRRDGVQEIVGPGALRHDCPPNPVVDAGPDCFAYRLRGEQVVPVAGRRRFVARYLLWPRYEDGAWEVIHYDYSVISS